MLALAIGILTCSYCFLVIIPRWDEHLTGTTSGNNHGISNLLSFTGLVVLSNDRRYVLFLTCAISVIVSTNGSPPGVS